MGDIGTSMGVDPPAVGTRGTSYASTINFFLTEVQNRREALVPRASRAAGDLDLAGDALQNADYVGLATQAGAPTTPSNSLQQYGGNLYWLYSGGAVQITSGTTLNTTLVGGITGDYGGADRSLRADEALAPDRSRLFDYLNLHDERFVKVNYDDDSVCLVNKAYITCVTP